MTGWGFTVQSDPTHWISFVGSFLVSETNPALGAYTDRIGVSGGPADFVLPAAALPWEQSFNEADQTGLAAFALSLAAATEEDELGCAARAMDGVQRGPSLVQQLFCGIVLSGFRLPGHGHKSASRGGSGACNAVRRTDCWSGTARAPGAAALCSLLRLNIVMLPALGPTCSCANGEIFNRLVMSRSSVSP